MNMLKEFLERKDIILLNQKERLIYTLTFDEKCYKDLKAVIDEVYNTW